MKSIAFSLYANQLLSVTYINGFTNNDKMEKEIHAVFDGEYKVNMEWGSAKKSNTDVLIIPSPFAPIENKEKIPELYIPAKLFYEMKIVEIKKLVDNFFKEQQI